MSCSDKNNPTFYANPNALDDAVPCNPTEPPATPDGLAYVFAAVAGTVPPFAAISVGQDALNETTNEQWFVNSSYEWQQTIGV